MYHQTVKQLVYRYAGGIHGSVTPLYHRYVAFRSLSTSESLVMRSTTVSFANLFSGINSSTGPFLSARTRFPSSIIGSYSTRTYLLRSSSSSSSSASTLPTSSSSTVSPTTDDKGDQSHGHGSSGKTSKDSGKYIFSALTLLTFTLGCWQTYRYNWKVNLLEERKYILDQDPIDITTAGESTISSLSDLQRVQLNNVSSSITSNTQLFFIGPRPPPKNLPSSLQTQANAGYLVIEPIQRQQDKSQVLLLRGWVPADMVHTIVPLSSSSIVGILRQSEHPNVWSTLATSSPVTTTTSSSSSSIKSSSSKYKPLPNPSNQYIYLDIPTIAKAAGFDTSKGDISTILIESLPSFSPSTTTASFPIQRDPSTLYETHTMPFTHGVYAATWFSLAIAGIFLTRMRFRSGSNVSKGLFVQSTGSTRNRRNIAR